MKANYRNLLVLSFVVFFGTSVQAQELLFTPDGGVYPNNGSNNVGIGTEEPEGKLDVRDYGESQATSTLQIHNAQTNRGGTPVGPKYAILVKQQEAFTGLGFPNDPGGHIRETFSVQSDGKTASGIFVEEPEAYLSTRYSFGVHLGPDITQRIQLRYGVGSRPELSWRTSSNRNFYFRNENNATTPMVLSPTGKVGINTEDFFADHRLYVNGSVYITNEGADPHSIYIEGSGIAEEFFIKAQQNWPDYVFAPNYALMPLAEVGIYIEDHGRLPGMPSADQVAEEGIALGETQRLLTEKVEELTLYLLEMSSRLRSMTEQYEAMTKQYDAVNEEMEDLREEITTLRGEK